MTDSSAEIKTSDEQPIAINRDVNSWIVEKTESRPHLSSDEIDNDTKKAEYMIAVAEKLKIDIEKTPFQLIKFNELEEGLMKSIKEKIKLLPLNTLKQVLLNDSPENNAMPANLFDLKSPDEQKEMYASLSITNEACIVRVLHDLQPGSPFDGNKTEVEILNKKITSLKEFIQPESTTQAFAEKREEIDFGSDDGHFEQNNAPTVKIGL